MAKTLYEALGINSKATREEIESACIKLGEKYSPAHNPGDLSARVKFSEVERAYATLLDDRKRQAYDATIHGPGPLSSSSAYWGWGISLFALAAIGYGGFIYWEHAEKQRAQEAARKTAAPVQTMEQPQLPQRSISNQSMQGSIAGQDELRRRDEAAKAREKLRHGAVTAQNNLAVIRRVAQDLDRLSPYWRRVVSEFTGVSNVTSEYGGRLYLGRGEIIAQETRLISVTGCAVNVQSEIVSLALAIDTVANYWVTTGYAGGVDSKKYTQELYATINQCKQLIEGDIQRLSKIQ